VTLVSHKHRFVFLKTRKTGGTSFEMLLEPYCAPADHEVVHHTTGRMSREGIVGVRVSPARFDGLRSDRTMPQTLVIGESGEPEAIEWLSHTPASRVKRALGSRWDSYRRITSVRNPFTRAVSFFFHEMDIGNLPWTTDLDEARPAFSAFVHSGRFRDDTDITHIDGELVVHDAFRLEHRTQDVARIGERLGLPLDAADLLHMKNVGKQRASFPARELFDDDTADAVRQASAWVFDTYGYSRDLSDADLDPPAEPAHRADATTAEDTFCRPDCPDCLALSERRRARAASGV
jgi:hypothetical protein